MKKLLVLLLFGILVFFVSRISLAVDPDDAWYKVEPTKPYYDLYYTNHNLYFKNFGGSFKDNTYGVHYYQNEQTFLSIGAMSDDQRNQSYIFNGKYLFANGFFIGLFYFESEFAALIYNGNSISNRTNIVTPGYRYNIDDHSFAAISVDYHFNDQDYGFDGVNIQFNYNPDNMKIEGTFYIPFHDENFVYSLGGDYQFNDAWVAGIDYENEYSFSRLSSGVTWTSGAFTTNAAIGNYDSSSSDYTYYRVGVIYQPKDLGIGIIYNKRSDYTSPEIMIQAKYLVKNVKVVLEYKVLDDSDFRDEQIKITSKVNL